MRVSGRISSFTLGREWIMITWERKRERRCESIFVAKTESREYKKLTSCRCVIWVGEHGREWGEGLVRRPFASVGDVGAGLALVHLLSEVTR